jgi:hypothetical protein
LGLSLRCGYQIEVNGLRSLVAARTPNAKGRQAKVSPLER